ncbi:MAG TPA: pilus assembly protein N-terminal domain-containing protein [bacterium]|nr:pilus assembly protein N-terminal domain-containing protein [bacterium]
MKPRGAVARGAALALGLALAATAATAAPQPPPLTVHVAGSGTRTSLRLQPGYATVLRADRRIDTVAIGDPRLVTATAVKRGQDVYDLILQPRVSSGATNMVVWLGNLTTVWDLEVGPALRTADLVYVVTGARGASAPPVAADTTSPPGPSGTALPPPVAAGSAAAASRPSQPPATAAAVPVPLSGAPPGSTTPTPAGTTSGRRPGQDGVASPAPMPTRPVRPDPVAERSAGAPLLQARQTIGDVTAVFQIARVPDGVLIRYQITNNGDADLAIRPTGVLVRVNGRLVPYALARASADQSRPDTLPPGATETGVIEAPTPAARSVQVILSLFPVASADEPSGAHLPLTFEPSFAGVDRLAPTTNP